MAKTEDPLSSSLTAMRKAYEQAVAAIEAVPDGEEAFSQATQLREAADALVGGAAELRARMAGRIWEAEEMSLAALAQRIGVSKTRADQLIKAARAATTTTEDQ